MQLDVARASTSLRLHEGCTAQCCLFLTGGGVSGVRRKAKFRKLVLASLVSLKFLIVQLFGSAGSCTACSCAGRRVEAAHEPKHFHLSWHQHAQKGTATFLVILGSSKSSGSILRRPTFPLVVRFRSTFPAQQFTSLYEQAIQPAARKKK